MHLHTATHTNANYRKPTQKGYKALFYIVLHYFAGLPMQDLHHIFALSHNKKRARFESDKTIKKTTGQKDGKKSESNDRKNVRNNG